MNSFAKLLKKKSKLGSSFFSVAWRVGRGARHKNQKKTKKNKKFFTGSLKVPKGVLSNRYRKFLDFSAAGHSLL